jgi:hypothetical protein
MTKADDAEAKQAMLKALADYTGPITRAMAKPETKTCRLSEFGECQNEFVPSKKKKWTKFCCTAHRKRWHYLDCNGASRADTYRDAVEDAENGHVNGHAPNGHDHAEKKITTLADLGLGAQPTTQFKRRKLTTRDAN